MRFDLLLLAAVLALGTRAGANDAERPPSLDGEIAIEHSRLESVSGCDNHYAVYRPPGAATSDLVLVVPGFMRDRDRMRGWAEAIAERGLVAATMDFCQPTAFDGRHQDNARDMIALRVALGATRVVYVGHSAGGLASLLAANADGAARGMVLLDPVDFAGLGRNAAGRNRVPGIGLLATPGACNLGGNMRRALERMQQVSTVPIAGATHCDFEWPPDGLCRAMCDLGGPGREQRIAAEREIRALAIEFILSALRAEPSGVPQIAPSPGR